MKTKIAILLLPFLMAFTFALAAEKPQYGGTLTYCGEFCGAGPTNFNSPDGADPWVTWNYTSPFIPHLMTGDFEKYGPRGTNEFSFQYEGWVPQKYLKGEVLESWELQPDGLTVVVKIRKGIMWNGNPNLGMKPRELNSYDVVLSTNKAISAPHAKARFGFLDYVTPVDKYTLQYKMNKYEADWWFYLFESYMGGVMPVEVWESGDPGNWKNAVGSDTRPFIITNYEPDVGVYYKKNPNYRYKTTIDGKAYKIPFVDELAQPIIPDESTRVAALRTGKVDIWPFNPLLYEESLKKSAPELIMNKLDYGADIAFIRSAGHPILSKKAVRQALHMAIDYDTLIPSVYGDGYANAYPIPPGLEEYTPVDQLPAEAKKLFKHNPEKAKQMIVDAGYPNGFSTSVVVGSNPIMNDSLAMVKNYWKAIGVNLAIEKVSDAAWGAAFSGGPGAEKAFKDMITCDYNSGNYVFQLYDLRTDGRLHATADPVYMEKFWEQKATVDPAERAGKIKELAKYTIEQGYVLPLAFVRFNNTWWPWVKNHYGAVEVNIKDAFPPLATVWIDQKLKAKMGY